MLTFEREDGKTMCLRPDLTVASCISFLQKSHLKFIILVKHIEDQVIKIRTLLMINWVLKSLVQKSNTR